MTIVVEIQHTSGACVITVLVEAGNKEGWKLKRRKKEEMAGCTVTLRREKPSAKEVIKNRLLFF